MKPGKQPFDESFKFDYEYDNYIFYKVNEEGECGTLEYKNGCLTFDSPFGPGEIVLKPVGGSSKTSSASKNKKRR